MASLHLLLILSCGLCCSAEFSDHMQTYEKQCLGEDKMQCADGTCVWQHQYCDGNVDCPDGSDEDLCPNHTPEPHFCNPESHFLCFDMLKCIPNTWVCNNETECDDGSDEADCASGTEESEASNTCKGFTCKSDQRCISPLWACDGTYDCEDRSDENTDTCKRFGHDRFEREQECKLAGYRPISGLSSYTCLNDSSCIEGKYMCNGLQDCRDGSDEGPFCDNWKQMCANNNCTNGTTCFPNRNGRMCACQDYQTYDELTRQCKPTNSCAEARPHCNQVCEIRNSGGFHCRCAEGYHLDKLKIGYLCIAPEPEPLLFFSTRDEIKYITVRTKKIFTVATGIKKAHGVAYDGEYVYWVETADGHEAIVRAPLTNINDRMVLVGLGLEDPGDISIDWRGGNFYFSDAQRGTISACKIDGKMCVTIQTDARTPKHLTLDVANGKMYWADWHDKPVIMSAYMDGSDPAVLVEHLDSFPTGLAVDYASGRLYYVDKVLKGCRLDNGRVFTVAQHHHSMVLEPYAVAVFESIIYWSDFVSNTIQHWEKLSTNSLGSLATFDSPVFGLHMYHPIISPSPYKLASNSSKQHVRLVGKNGTYPVCPEGLELDEQDRCEPTKDYRPSYIVVGHGSTFTLVQYDSLGGHDSVPVHLKVGRVQAMAYDSLRDVLYIYDADWKAINYIAMKDFYTGALKTLLFMGLDDVVDMDYDYVTDNLYFADAGRKFIEVVSLKTGKRAIIHRFEQETPVSLCVVPDYGQLLVAVLESDEHDYIQIESFGLDGTERSHIVMGGLRGPMTRLRYSEKMGDVYMAVEGNHIIDRLHPLGTGRDNYRLLSTSVTELAVTDNLVLWTTRRGHRLYFADINDYSRNIRRVELLMFPNNTHLHIQATRPHPGNNSWHPCHAEPCTDVCVQTPMETHFSWVLSTIVRSPLSTPSYKCLCPPGLLSVDGKCTELVTCTEEEAFCHNSNVCIMKTQLCDGKKDCEHGEDEEACTIPLPPNPKCPADEKRCGNMCVHKSVPCVLSVTTTQPAVAVTTDATPAPEICTHLQFACSEVLCIDRSQICDRKTDCPDGSDEAKALCDIHNCYATEYMCSSGQCIQKTFVCDGAYDCNDGSDEFSCYNSTCAVGEFQCRNLECVHISKRCDHVPDCTDSSDEEYCDDDSSLEFHHFKLNATEEPETENCPAWEYTCELNRTICLPLTTRCNGKIDCPGGTDEGKCDCSMGRLKCRQENACIDNSRVCDGHKDCVDGEDEVEEACARVNRTSDVFRTHMLYPRQECHGGYLCEQGQCIEWRSVCDNHTDCYDLSDENGLCMTACVNHTCEFSCQPTPKGPLCKCPHGYKLNTDQVTCIDEDECALDMCSQHCYNTPGSFVCGCHRGYVPGSDGRTCKVIKGEMSLLVVAGNSVHNIRLHNSMYSTEYTDDGASNITDIAYDIRRKELYVTTADLGKLVAKNSTHQIVITNVGRPTKVAVDWIAGSAYFADVSAEYPHMRVCHMHKQRCAVLQKLPYHSNVTALAIDPASRKLFYCVTRELESVVWSSTLSGKGLTQITIAGYCTGLAVDSYKKRLYVAETGPARLYAMNYEGTMFKDLLTNDRHLQAPQDLALFEDHIYYLDANTKKLSRCLVFDKQHCEPYLEKLFGIDSFVMRHEVTQRDDLINLCENSQCSNVCVQGDLVGICVCDDGWVSKDGSCPLYTQNKLPLFNGTLVKEYQRTSSSALVVTVMFLVFITYVGGFLYYYFIYKRRREENLNYTPVHFQNTTEGSLGEGSSSPISFPTIQMPTIGRGYREFVNPLEYIRNWRPFRRNVRPVGTAGLQFDVPPMDSQDVSDTESDIDYRDTARIVK